MQGEEQEQFIEAVMEKIEKFYFDDSQEVSGKSLFFNFAKEHKHLFDEDCSAEETENKLE